MSSKLIGRGIALALGLAAGSAPAAFHLMKVVEVFGGTAAAPNAQYVVIQMYTGGQNQLTGHGITVFNAAGQVIQTFTFPGSVPNGANQAKILIATAEAASFFNLTANLTMTAVLPRAGGKVCFDSQPEDCFAWGNYSGSSAGVGTPFNASTGLQLGKAAIRRLDIAGFPSALDSGDDTDNCANDFVSGTPVPRNNANVTGTIPPSVCPNNVIDGLEECDDGNANNGDGCSSMCLIEPNIYANGFEDLMRNWSKASDLRPDLFSDK